jgi:Tol biopolymer transport system component
VASFEGQTIGRYHILEQLGKGGMAVVYRGFDYRLERSVAIKVIRTGGEEDDIFLKRFEREAKSLAQLQHPHIVGVIDFGEHEGLPYLVMEYLPGGTLKQLMGRPMECHQAAELLAPVARALEHAHQAGILHRDVKPANILLTAQGQAMLSDFGIAKILESNGSNDTLTGTGVGIGTPEYMAPEQWLGKAEERTDIYSLGVVLYELITGMRPFSADTPAAVLLKVHTDPLPSPKRLVAGLSDEAEAILLRALARKPEDRFASMGDFAKALERLARSTSSPQETTAPSTARGAATEYLPVRPPATTTVATTGQPSSARGSAAPPPAAGKSRRTGMWVGLLIGGGAVGLCVVVILAVVLLRGLPFGSPAAAVPPTSAPTLAPTAAEAPTAAPVATDVPTAAPAPTATEAPTAAPTAPIPTATLAFSSLPGGCTGKLAFFSYRDGNDNIYLMNADGTDPQRLTDYAGMDKLPVWSHDGQAIAFTSMRNGWNVYMMHADGSGVMQLTNVNFEIYVNAWSADITALLLTGRSGQRWEVFKYSGDGNNLTRPVSSEAVSLHDIHYGVGPDEIFYLSGDGANQTLWQENLANQVKTSILANTNFFYGFSLSPDGQTIVYSTGGQLYSIRVDGSQRKQLTNSTGGNFSPAWSPDGMKIAFTSGRNGNNEIYMMNADGSSPLRLTNNPANDDGVDWQPCAASQR